MSINDPKRAIVRLLIATVIGLIGAVIIWITVPLCSIVVGTPNVSDSYLPTAVVLFVLLLVLAVNPLLRMIRPVWALSTRQLAVAVALMLMACVAPGQGVMRALPYALCHDVQVASDNKAVSDQYHKMNLPPSLFPDKIGFDEETPAAEGYLKELRKGEGLPWSRWFGPLLSWGIFLLFTWMMMIGLAMIVLPQWRNNERLAFPLLTVQQALIQAPEPGRLLPPLLRTRTFWLAVAAVLVVHMSGGLSIYLPETIPAIPLKWNLKGLFAEDPWRQMPGYIHTNQVYFLFIGLAFFMPTRISFSIWFFLILAGAWRAFAYVYGIQNYIEKMDDQRYGALLALTVAVLWIGRSQWARVFASLFRRPKADSDAANRRSGWMFLIGLAGMFGWLMWIGVQPLWALLLIGFVFMVSLVLSRFVAETGLPFVRLYEDPLTLMKLAPVGWLSPVSVWASVLFDHLFSYGSRLNPAVMATHAIGLDDEASPRRQTGMGMMLLGALAVGLIVAGASNLIARNYHSTTLDGRQVEHVNDVDEANAAVGEVNRGQLSLPQYNQYVQLGIGAGLASALYYLCLTVPQWPIHPFGMVLIDSHYGHAIWASVFMGWLLQILIVRFGGARLYRLARPFFLGLIVGEMVAALIWGVLVPLVLLWLGQPYRPVSIFSQ